MALTRRPDGMWEIGSVKTDGASGRRYVYLRTVDGGALHLKTSLSTMEEPLSFAAPSDESDVPGLFTIRPGEGGTQLLFRTLGEESSRVIGTLGEVDGPVLAAFSGVDPIVGLMGLQGSREVLSHRSLGGDQSVWEGERERRQLRVAVVDGTRISQTILVPWGPTTHPCSGTTPSVGVLGSLVAAQGDHRVAAWRIGLVDDCEMREELHVTWLGPRGRRVRSAQQPLPWNFPFGGLGMIVGDDGSVSVLRRSFAEGDRLSIGLFGFDSLGAPVPHRTTRIRARTFGATGSQTLAPFPLIRCAESAWLPFLSRTSEEEESRSIELWTLPVPLAGPFGTPQRRWRSLGGIQCDEDTFVSACVGDEAAIAAKCRLLSPPGPQGPRLLFRSWPAE